MDIELTSFFLPLPRRRSPLLLLLLHLFLRPSSTYASSNHNDDEVVHPHPLRPSRGLVITVLVSLGFLLVAFLILYFQNCRRRNLDGEFSLSGLRRERREKPGLDRAVIDSFPTLVYSEVKQLNHNDDYHVECAVCLGEFGDREKLRLLPGCKHVFHLDCIDMWLDSHTTCPVCRAQLDAGFPETAGTVAPAAEMDLSRTWTERERERFSLRADPQVLIRCSSMGRDEGGSGRVHGMARWVSNAMSERWTSLARMAPLNGLTAAGEGTSGGQSRTATDASIV